MTSPAHRGLTLPTPPALFRGRFNLWCSITSAFWLLRRRAALGSRSVLGGHGITSKSARRHYAQQEQRRRSKVCMVRLTDTLHQLNRERVQHRRGSLHRFSLNSCLIGHTATPQPLPPRFRRRSSHPRPAWRTVNTLCLTAFTSALNFAPLKYQKIRIPSFPGLKWQFNSLKTISFPA